ncbi:DUF58 domain-containing protein [Ilumatobacter sp.]|uniref:DUF58 domain-containing protein n=1 Tax=Ilumatobacter sp. TaxID=1967498 RepID=UPI003C418A29
MTRYGILAILAALVSIAIGRAFGVVELFVIGAGFIGAVAAAAVFVALRSPSVSGVRRIRPSILVAGDIGHVDLALRHHGALRSTRFTLHERVRRINVPDQVAELTVEPMRARGSVTATYQLPTSRRGAIELGPLESVVRDPLGLLVRTRIIAGTDRITVAPRSHLLAMPQLGTGPLGRHLLAQARRLGPGEFHGLREYIDGDEPRSIHWRASARGENLLVKQYEVEGLRRMLIVLDTDPDSYADPMSFERAVTVAASLALSATHADLVTRFVSGDVDLRGPEVAADALRVLAEIQPDGAPLPMLDHESGEGVGLLVAIGGSRDAAGLRRARGVVDPTQATVAVTTDETSHSAIGVNARTEAEFLSNWNALIGKSGARRATGAKGTTQ